METLALHAYNNGVQFIDKKGIVIIYAYSTNIETSVM